MSKQEFKVGDRVEFVEDYVGLAKEGEQGTVKHVDEEWYTEDSRHATQLVKVELDSGIRTTCFNFRLKIVEAEEQEAEPQPVTYRICVGSNIGTTEYLSLEAAKEAALQHGIDKEAFSIFEVVKIADYRVKVEKSLEAA
jgi:hypothetical protein